MTLTIRKASHFPATSQAGRSSEVHGMAGLGAQLTVGKRLLRAASALKLEAITQIGHREASRRT